MFKSSDKPSEGGAGNELNLRLEALRLADNPGKTVEEVIGRAQRYEHFLMNGEDKGKSSDNPFD